MSKSLALFLLVVIVAAGAWFWFHRGERTPPSTVVKATPAAPVAPPSRAPPPPAAASEPVPAAPATPRPPSPPPARKITLADLVQPPPDAPVRDVVAKLADAANQGVPQAACRLGYELLRCARASRGFLALERAQKAAAAAKDPREVHAAGRDAMQIAQTIGRDAQACRDVTEAETNDAWRYVYIGAANGSVAAMTRFVRDPGIPGTPGSSDYAEAWAAYTRDAPQFLAEAIRAGDVRALYQGYVSALTGQSAGGAGVFARNPEKAIAYAVALRGLRDRGGEQEIERQMPALIDQVGPARADAARQQGEKMRTDFFANAAPLSGAQDRAIDAAECWK